MGKDKEWVPRHIDTAGLEDLKKGYDAADLIESGVTQKQFLAWMKERLRPGPPAVHLEAVKNEPTSKKKKPVKEPEKRKVSEVTVESNIAALRKPDEEEFLGTPPEFSEDGLAERFTKLHANTMKFCKPWDTWMTWDETHWKPDDTAESVHLARQVCKKASSQVMKRVDLGDKRYKIAEKISTLNTIMHVERLARSDRRHVIIPAKFDADPWVLNTPGGIVDLRTGKVRPARIGDYVSKITRVAPEGECPRWLQFLKEATNGDAELESYLKRVAGYCLTGSIAEHAFFFCYGTGGNGKGIFKDTIDWILHNYATVANMDTFTEQRFSKHSAEIAYFQGARLVTATETSEGSRWNEARIKALTGGDPITAEWKHKDPFTYKPLFKLIFTGNWKPQLRNVDPAIKRRLYLIPFENQIPAEKRDITLPDKMKAEAGGILKWMIEGCLEWQEGMLQPPRRVLASTSEYLDEEDRIGRFLEELCNEGPHERVQSTLLYTKYKYWADINGEFAVSSKRFHGLLHQKGFASKKLSGQQVVLGLSMK